MTPYGQTRPAHSLISTRRRDQWEAVALLSEEGHSPLTQKERVRYFHRNSKCRAYAPWMPARGIMIVTSSLM